MLNTIVVDFYLDHTKMAIHELENNEIIKIKYWLVDNKYCDLEIKHTFEEVQNTFVDIYIPDDIYNEGRKYLYYFINIQNRWVDSTEVSNYVHDFHLYFKYWYSIFQKENIELLLMGNAPHAGITYMAYVVAKILNVKILITEQICQIQNRFICFKDLQRVGYRDFNPFNSQSEYQHIENKFEKDLFYMKNIEPELNSSDLDITKFFDVKRILRKMREKKSCFFYFALQKISYKVIRMILSKEFRKTINTLDINFDKNKKFVYFPLHFQPEMTTDTLGGMYEDQIIALEKIAYLIPDDWVIYIKENPKQTYYKRSRRFFDRIGSIKKVQWVNSKISTYALIASSQFVATITGTVGWEAVSGGKNVLLFGAAWYRTLPGIFEYTKNMDINKLLTYKINHAELEDKFNYMYNNILLPGVIAGGNGKDFYSSFDSKDNNFIVYNSLKLAIDKY